MRAEEVYNIAIHLPEKELEQLYALLGHKLSKRKSSACKRVKKKLVTNEEVRRYLLKTVFKVDV